jgi:hypothetical protein
MSRPPTYTDDDVRAAVAGALSLAAALRVLGLRPAGGSHVTLKKHIARLGLSTEHFRRDWNTRPSYAMPLERVLVSDSHYSRASLKRRLYTSGLKERRCELCGQDEIWRECRISLILDHINGMPTDNRLENLRIVCPNCASTLETHCGRKDRAEVEPRFCLRCGASSHRGTNPTGIAQEHAEFITATATTSRDHSDGRWYGRRRNSSELRSRPPAFSPLAESTASAARR